MSDADDIVEAFLVESAENLARFDRNLVELGKHPDDRDIVEAFLVESARASIVTWWNWRNTPTIARLWPTFSHHSYHQGHVRVSGVSQAGGGDAGRRESAGPFTGWAIAVDSGDHGCVARDGRGRAPDARGHLFGGPTLRRQRAGCGPNRHGCRRNTRGTCHPRCGGRSVRPGSGEFGRLGHARQHCRGGHGGWHRSPTVLLPMLLGGSGSDGGLASTKITRFRTTEGLRP
jgi:hypothetical protein